MVVILDLQRQGLSVSAIARRVGLDRKTVRRYLERGLEPPTYGPRPPRQSKLDPLVLSAFAPGAILTITQDPFPSGRFENAKGDRSSAHVAMALRRCRHVLAHARSRAEKAA